MELADATQARVQLFIRLDTLRKNLELICNHVAPCRVIAVLKANAYGLGVRNIAKALAQAGISAFAVAELREALELADLNLPIMLLGSLLPGEIAGAHQHGILCPLSDHQTLAQIESYLETQSTPLSVQIVVDTGMGRLGFLPQDLPAVLERVKKQPKIKLVGAYSHFPSAYLGPEQGNLEQLQTMTNLHPSLQEAAGSIAFFHMANSDAVNNLPQSFAKPFDAVRVGINLHGSFDPVGQRVLQLEPVLELRAQLASVRELPQGFRLGYGGTYRLARPTLVGTVAAGYADGLPLALSNRGYVLIHNIPCPILGRVSMDYITVDLAQVPAAKVGDSVICLGGSGTAAITVEDWAHLKGTHAYEIICAIGSRVQRVYL